MTPPTAINPEDIQIGSVLKFPAPEQGVTDPHYFIIVAINDDEYHFVEGTSQKEKKEAYFDRNGLDYSTLICIPPDGNSGFTKDTYVNCNDNYPFTLEDLNWKAYNDEITAEGRISYDHYDQIRKGIKNSRLNDLPKDWLIHPEDNE